MVAKTFSSCSWTVFKTSSDLNRGGVLDVGQADESLKHAAFSVASFATVNDHLAEMVSSHTLMILSLPCRSTRSEARRLSFSPF